VSIGNKDSLQKVGNSLYMIKDTIDPEMTLATEAKLHQGFLEASNVNPVREMTDMITATRVFESTQKGIQAYDQMLAKTVSEVPKVTNIG
jgi:flagellar basal-body rod protein FlgG